MKRTQGAGRVFVSFALVVAGAIAIALLVKGLYPTDLPESRNPDFVDNVFDNRGVLWAARLLLVSAAVVLAFGGVFIVLSIGIRMKNGEWLRRAGPFEISEDLLSRTRDRADFWHQAAVRSEEEVIGLREELRQLEDLVARLR